MRKELFSIFKNLKDQSKYIAFCPSNNKYYDVQPDQYHLIKQNKEKWLGELIIEENGYRKLNLIRKYITFKYLYVEAQNKIYRLDENDEVKSIASTDFYVSYMVFKKLFKKYPNNYFEKDDYKYILLDNEEIKNRFYTELEIARVLKSNLKNKLKGNR